MHTFSISLSQDFNIGNEVEIFKRFYKVVDLGMYICMYVRAYACMYACMYVYIYVYIYIYIYAYILDKQTRDYLIKKGFPVRDEGKNYLKLFLYVCSMCVLLLFIIIISVIIIESPKIIFVIVIFNHLKSLLLFNHLKKFKCYLIT